MKEKRRKRSFLDSDYPGAIGGLFIWFVIIKLWGQYLSWWMELIILMSCIALCIFLQKLHNRKIKPDIVIRNNKIQNEEETLE